MLPIVIVLAALPCVQGAEYTVAGSTLYRQGVLSGTDADYYLFFLETGDKAVWSVTNTDRKKMDVILLPQEQYQRAAAGLSFTFIPTASSVNSSAGASRRYDNPGSYALMVRPSSGANGSAAYTITITLQRPPARSAGGGSAVEPVLGVAAGAAVVGGVGGALALFHLYFAIKGLASSRRSPLPEYRCPDCGGKLRYDQAMERWFCAGERRWL